MGSHLKNDSKIAKWILSLPENKQNEVKWAIADIYRDKFTPQTAGAKVNFIISGKPLKVKRNVELRIIILDICKKFDKDLTYDKLFD